MKNGNKMEKKSKTDHFSTLSYTFVIIRLSKRYLIHPYLVPELQIFMNNIFDSNYLPKHTQGPSKKMFEV